ncbi:MAG: hypothetical protein MI741_07240 [Rhodospirillales bacterium]|nr:hypothetical protein [Rhodospirillales bacterium]
MPEKDVFAVLPAGRRVWAVASVHGEVVQLRALHGKLADLIEPGDCLVYLGNLIGHGPRVFETLEEILLFRRALLARPGADCAEIAFVRGSQEEMWHRLLQIQFAINPAEVLAWMFDHGAEATVRAYGSSAKEGLEAASKGAVALTEWTGRLRRAMRTADGHNALISSLRRAAFTEDRSVLMVSAGIDVSRPLSQQFDSFWWGATPFHIIQESFCDFRRVVRGFDLRRRGIDVGVSTASLDGGCGFGGPLNAACFDAKGNMCEQVAA